MQYRTRRLLVWLAVVGLLPSITGCFEDPVEEVLELCLLEDGSVTVQLAVSVHGDSVDEGSALDARLTEARRSFEIGYGPWHDRFDRLGKPLADGMSLQRVDGELESYGRWAVVNDSERSLNAFFSDVPISVLRIVGEDGGAPSELILYPTAGDRASSHERATVNAALDAFADGVDDYYRAVDAVYRHLHAHPQRTLPVMKALFEDVLPSSEEAADVPELTPREEALVRAVGLSEDAVLKIFETEKDEAFTLQEMSRKVFDPLPAELNVRVPGNVIEMAGFEEAEGALRAKRLSLWDAVAQLEGRFLSPDVLVVKVRVLMGNGGEFSMEQLLDGGTLESEAPHPGEVRRALIQELAPPPAYRVVWLQRAAEGDTENRSDRSTGTSGIVKPRVPRGYCRPTGTERRLRDDDPRAAEQAR